ncbi:hypothetical protein SAMN05444338_10331 [Flavobacterium degerlachei]|uniref:Uncharacterized protein n=1 Tax=Flavobacterium degerlachei TaxID=229203 RepID=A0A1H2TWS1_9FLAO|nr:hypothetical protein SAMN05444338_10331 [Flavobacterium degerlachei]
MIKYVYYFGFEMLVNYHLFNRKFIITIVSVSNNALKII